MKYQVNEGMQPSRGVKLFGCVIAATVGIICGLTVGAYICLADVAMTTPKAGSLSVAAPQIWTGTLTVDKPFQLPALSVGVVQSQPTVVLQ